MKLRKVITATGACLGVVIVLWCVLIVALLTLFYPREIRRVSGPDGMEAVLKYGPTASSHPIFTLLLPLLGTNDNCHVFVDVEKEGRQIMRLDIIGGGDLAEDHDDSRIEWSDKSLTVIDEASGHTQTWNFFS